MKNLIPYFSLADLKDAANMYESKVFETSGDWRFLDYENNAVHFYCKK